MPEGVETIAHADDLAHVMTARNEATLEARVDDALARVFRLDENSPSEARTCEDGSAVPDR